MPSGSRLGAGDWPLVGRDDEIGRIGQAFRSATTTGIVLAGPAGVGKTRLAHECLLIAEAEGFTITRVVATRAAATIPLGALAPLLSDARAGDPRTDSVRAAASAIAARGGDQPLVLFVDDAQLLDDASAAVVHQLAFAGAALTVVTVRTGEPTKDAVLALWKDAGSTRIDLGALTRAETEQVAVAALGGPIDGATTRDLFDASGGNPLYLRELVLGALETGVLREEQGLWRLAFALTASPRLVDLVEVRLVDLTEVERQALEVIALGEPLEFEILERVTDLAVLEGLERRGLVTTTAADGRRRARLGHPIHGEVLRARMPGVRAMLVSRQLASAVESGGGAVTADPVRVALWHLDGGETASPELLHEAARRAFFAHAPVLAERLARGALDAGAGVPAGQLLGEALRRLGRHEEAVAVLAALMPMTTTDEERALVAMARAETLLWGLSRDADSVAVLVEAEHAVAPGPWRDELVGMRATGELLAGRPRVAVEIVSDILESSAGRPLAEAAIAAAPALAVIGRCDEAVAVADRGFAAHVALGVQAEMSHPGIHVVARALALGEAGRFAEAEATARAGYDAAIAEKASEGHAWFALILARVALGRGQIGTAAHRFREGASVFADLAQNGTRRWCVAGLVLTAAALADGAQAQAALEELDELGPTEMLMMEPDVDRARAWGAWVVGDTRRARDLLRGAAERARQAGSYALEAGALHDVARLGAPEAAVDRLAELADMVDGHLTAGRARHAEALVRRDGAALEQVSTDLEGIGALLLAAEAAAAASAAHRKAGESRWAHRCAHRATALAMRCERARTPGLALAREAAATLTAREHEVAQLAAEGMTSKAIAEQLVVSVRTVHNHLQRAFEKLGVSSRAALGDVLQG